MYQVDVDNFDQWRESARALLRRDIAPDQIAWNTSSSSQLDFDEHSWQDLQELSVKHHELNVPRDFMQLAKNVACFRDDEKWSLLYSVAWRILFEDRNVLLFKVDHQVASLLKMQKAINRDMHKMKAFVRFKKIETGCGDADVGEPREQEEALAQRKNENSAAEEHFVSWFEPQHAILPLVSSFFVKRFHNMSWSILTPDVCAHWDQETLSYSKGIQKMPNVAKADDELEQLWLEYYASTFNPARLKLKAMQSEMPKKYWQNLPEAPLIKALSRSAYARMDTMISEPSQMAWHKTAKSRYVAEKQAQLRNRKPKT